MSVTTEDRDNVTWIIMDDGKANALSTTVLAELDSAIDAASQSRTKAIVICGRPGRFSAGFDLKTMMAGPEEAKGLVKQGAEVIMKLYGVGKPVVGACTGHAMAGGALVLLACDQRVGVAGDFKIGLNETSIGVVLPRFALALADARLDPRQHCQATLQATIYNPETAASVGFLDRVVDADGFEEAVQQEALRLGGLVSRAYAHLKREQRGAVIEQVLSEVDANLADIVPS